jgi:hypothetical protein
MTTSTRGLAGSVRHLDRRGAALLLGALFVPIALLVMARKVPALDPVFESPSFHLYVVSAIAGCALFVAIAAAASAVRDGRSETVLLALGCVTVGTLMLGHGLTTPGMIRQPMNLWIARFPVFALTAFATCLTVSVGIRSSERKPVARTWALLVFPSLVSTLFVAAIVVDPTILSGAAPVPGEDQIRAVLSFAGGVALLAAGAVRWRRWRLGRDPIEFALALACWLAMASIVSFTFGQLWRLSWWDYHIYLLGGFGAAAWSVVAGYRRTRNLDRVIEGVTVHDPVEQVARRQPDALHALIGAVEAKDRYTHGHSHRVAELSTRIALELGLTPEQTRGLHQGAYLHDVGKISVPDHVLNKPGELDPEEWELIVGHPEIGWDLVSRAPSLRGALSAVRNHHERWDGSGYPDRLSGADIPLAGRIVAIADVWDALTSDRAYRPAWEPDRAISYIARGSGTLFDPACIEAFLEVVAQEGLVPERTRADLAGLMDAAADCHAVERRATASSASRVSRGATNVRLAR